MMEKLNNIKFNNPLVTFCVILALITSLALTPFLNPSSAKAPQDDNAGNGDCWRVCAQRLGACMREANERGNPSEGSEQCRLEFDLCRENCRQADVARQQGRGEEHRADPCSNLNPPGHAYGLRRRCAPQGSSAGVAKGDFNNDGLADLAVGVPREDVGTITDAGAVNIIYGSANGLTAVGNQFWTQNSEGILNAAEPGDQFGSALASGDFNGDGYSDLAVGVPKEDVETSTRLTGLTITMPGRLMSCMAPPAV